MNELSWHNFTWKICVPIIKSEHYGSVLTPCIYVHTYISLSIKCRYIHTYLLLPWRTQISTLHIAQSYEIKSPPWTILWFRILGISSVENIKRLCAFMFQTWDNSQLLRRVLWISAELNIVSSLKHKNTQPLYIFKRENPQNSESQNGPRKGLDFIALYLVESRLLLLVRAMSYYDVGCGIFNLAHFLMYHNSLIFEGCYWFANDIIKYILPVGSMIKFWVTTFWFMKVAWLWCFMFCRNQKVITQNFIIEPTGDKYLRKSWFQLYQKLPE